MVLVVCVPEAQVAVKAAAAAAAAQLGARPSTL